VNAGYGFSDRNNDDNNFFNSFAFGGTGFSTLTTGGALAPVVPLTGVNTFGFTDTNRNRDGFVGGGQIGYNFQFTPGTGFVIGVEADIQYTDFGHNKNDDLFGLNGFGNGGIFTAAPVAPIAAGSGIAAPTGVGNGALGNVALFNGGNGLFNNNFARHDWFATVRGRLGYAWDRLLIYGTGGVAFRDNGNDSTNDAFFFGNGITSGASLVNTGFYTSATARAFGAAVAPANTFGFFNDSNKNDVGWTVGGGVEYAFTNNLTAKIEGLYVSFDRNRNDNALLVGNNVVGVSNTGAAVFTTGTGVISNRNRDDFAVVRAGLNYKFGTF